MKVGICLAYQKHCRDSSQGDTYGPDANFCRDVIGFVNIDLVEVDGCDLVGECLEDRADDSARTTPGCPKVKDCNPVRPADLMTGWPERW